MVVAAAAEVEADGLSVPSVAAASDIVWRRRRRTLDEICGKKLSSRLRGAPDNSHRRQPSAFKYYILLCVRTVNICIHNIYYILCTIYILHIYIYMLWRKLIVRRQPKSTRWRKGSGVKKTSRGEK